MKFTNNRIHDLFGPSPVATFVDCTVRHVLRQALLGIKVKNDRAIHPGGTVEGEWGPKDSSKDSSVLGSPRPHYTPIAKPTSEAMQGRRHILVPDSR